MTEREPLEVKANFESSTCARSTSRRSSTIARNLVAFEAAKSAMREA